MKTYEFTLFGHYRSLRVDYSTKRPTRQHFEYVPTSIRTLLVEANNYQEAKSQAGRLKRSDERFAS